MRKLYIFLLITYASVWWGKGSTDKYKRRSDLLIPSAIGFIFLKERRYKKDAETMRNLPHFPPYAFLHSFLIFASSDNCFGYLFSSFSKTLNIGIQVMLYIILNIVMVIFYNIWYSKKILNLIISTMTLFLKEIGKQMRSMRMHR